MKKLIYALLGAAFLAACQSNKPEVSGTLTGVDSDTLLVRVYNTSDPNATATLDTVPMKNGKFSFNVGDSVLKQVVIFAKPSSKPNADGSIPAMSMKAVYFPLIPGKKVTISGSIEDYKLSGDAFYDELTAVDQSVKGITQQLDSIVKIYNQLIQSGTPQDSILHVYDKAAGLRDAIQNVQRNYIRQHLDKEVSLYLLSLLPTEIKMEMLDSIAEPVRTGVLAPIYQKAKKSVDKAIALQVAKEMVKEGAQAPAFTLKDINGKDFSLASLKGKYVVLDFWGSWCGWCIKGMPDMKKLYNKYKGKVEIVGIDCNDTEEKWKKAVAEHQLPWINVRNEEERDVTTQYAVAAYPTKFIIDPNGKIVKIVVGEDEEFYTELEKMLR